MNDLVISLVQPDLVWENPAANRSHLEKMLSSLDPVADLIILPEMFTTGFSMETEKYAETMDGVSVQWMKEMALKTGANIIGSLIIKGGDNYFNRLLYIPEDGEIKWYDKRHLFRMAGEDENFTAGAERMICKLKGWNILPLVCYDLRFPVWSRLQNNEADLIVYIANWPQRRIRHWHILLQARAIENQTYVAGVNRVGGDGGGFQYTGGSVALDPLGNEIINLRNRAGVETARLSKQLLDDYRQKFPIWKDSDRFKIL